ncbi:molecular chaperone [Desulfitobacterium sp. Sab5]|uniref:TorD/DmsD family molecular chaperone n=1 Tax=Desulfitobacterium nosdiversum TaxID=3375356 RepID=UPI003CE8205C
MSSSKPSMDQIKRKKVYGFLATAFYEPSVNLVELLNNHNEWADIVLAVEELCGAEGELIRELPSTLAVKTKVETDSNEEDRAGKNIKLFAPEELSAILQDLRVEYTRLFLGPEPPPCPPYESVYDPNRPLEQKGTILGPATMAMEELLRVEGLAITLEYAEYADHIAIELELMYYLLAKNAKQYSEHKPNIQSANSFLKSRLLPWLPDFGDKLANEAKHPFYRILGRLLTSIINSEGIRYA